MYLEANPVQNSPRGAFNHKSEVSRNEGNMQQKGKEARRERGEKVCVGEKINLEKYLKNVCFSLLI